MNDQKIGEVEKSVKCGQEECKKHEKNVMIAGVCDEDKFVKCLDDITGRELPWQAVKQAREKECTKTTMNVKPLQSTMSFRSNTKWIDTEALEVEPIQLRSRIVAREFKSGDRSDLYAGTPPLESLKAILSIAAIHSPEFSLMHVDVSRAYFHSKAQRPVLVRLPADDRTGKDEGKIGPLKKNVYGTRDAASN